MYLPYKYTYTNRRYISLVSGWMSCWTWLRLRFGLRSGVQWTHCSIQYTSSRWYQFFLCWSLSFSKKPTQDGHPLVIQGCSATIQRQAIILQQCLIGTEGRKVCKENIPPKLCHYRQIQDKIELPFHAVYTKFWCLNGCTKCDESFCCSPEDSRCCPFGNACLHTVVVWVTVDFLSGWRSLAILL